MARAYDAVLLLAFGGPDSADDIRPFLARVLQGIHVPPDRLEEVARHYEAVGGRSPLNKLTFRQASALEQSLKAIGVSLPVHVGMRFAPPFIKDTLARMAEAGTKKVLAIILSPLQTEASWQRYQEAVRKAQAELGGLAPDVDYCPEWHAHPLFIEALTAQVARAFDPIKTEGRAGAHVVFTAHSIPESMSRVSPYVEQLQETTRLVAEKLHRGHWTIAFQSRSGNPAESWLEPDVRSVIRQLAARGVRTLVVVPVGFVCDHVEVLYDLDIEAKAVADSLGMRFFRASCVNDHPAFIRMMAAIIEQSIKSAEDRGSENRR